MASDNTTGHRAGEDAVFECSMCGDCCRGFGGTYVSEEDITAISEYIGVLRDRFVRAYCSLSGGKPVLTQGDNGRCIFLGQGVYDTSRKTPDVPAMAVYPRHSGGRVELAYHGGLLQRHENRSLRRRDCRLCEKQVGYLMAFPISRIFNLVNGMISLIGNDFT